MRSPVTVRGLLPRAYAFVGAVCFVIGAAMWYRGYVAYPPPWLTVLLGVVLLSFAVDGIGEA